MNLNRICWVVLAISFCVLTAKGSAGRQQREKLLYGTEDSDPTIPEYIEIDEDMAEQLWINCRLDFRHMKEAPTTEEMGAESNEIYLKARSLTKSGVQKFIFVLPPHIKHTLSGCLSKQYFLFRVSGEEASSKNWYTEYLQFLLGWHATSRRDLSDRSLQNRVTAPAPSAKPPSYGPSPSPVPSPAISPSPNYQSPVEPPEPYDSFNPDDSVMPPPSSSKHSSASPDSAPVLPSQGSSSSKRTVAIAVGVTATVTFLLVAFLFYCGRKCFGNKNGSGDGPKDDRPLLSLSFSDFSSGSSKKSYNFGNSLNKEKFEKLSFQASSGHNGRSSSLEMRPMENISHSSISEIIPSSRELYTASSNIHVPLPPPPGMPSTKKASPSPPLPPISSGVNPGPPPPPPPKAPPPPPPKAPAPPPPKAPALPKGPPPPKGAFPPRPPQPGVLPPKLTKQSASENDSSKTKLKPFFWDKVLANPDQSMVWHQISSGSFQFNEEMIESLFGYNAADKQKGERKKESSSSDPSSQYIQIIDPKKSQNLAILLRALNVTIEEVCDALSEGNELPTELLQTLLKMSPTAEEELKLRLFSGELSQLGPAERFLKALVDIPFAFKRLDALLYMGSFREEVSSLKESFATLEVACKELRNSRLFLKLLEAVLKTGNRMNDGTFRGGAQAFKLDTLLKLADVKGADGKTTLLHFVVQEIIRSEGVRALRQIRESGSFSSITSEDLAEDTYNETEDHYRSLGLQVVSGLSSELEHVKKAAVLDADALTSTVSILGHGLVKTKEFINTEMKSMDEESQFYKTLKHFVDNAEIDVTWLLEEEKKIRSLVKSTTDYFHGKAGKDEGLHLFVIVRDFLGMLDKTCKAVREAPKNVPKMPTIKESPAVPQVLDARQHLFPAIRDRRMGGSDSDED